MKYLDRTFWRMTFVFIIIIGLSLGAVYALKNYGYQLGVDRAENNE